MLPTASAVKQTAKTALKGKYFGSVLVSVILCFAAVFDSLLVSVVYTVLGDFFGAAIGLGVFVFLICPLVLGALLFTRRLLWGQNDNPIIIFKYFTEQGGYLRALVFSLHLFVRAFLLVLLFSLPALLVHLLASPSFYRLFGSTMPSFASDLWIVGTFLQVVAVVLAAAVMLKYFYAPFLLVSNDDISPLDAIRQSVLMSNGVISDILGFVLSNIGWIILCVFLIPLPFILPYLMTSYSVFSRFAVARYNKKITESGDTTPKFEP